MTMHNLRAVRPRHVRPTPLALAAAAGVLIAGGNASPAHAKVPPTLPEATVASGTVDVTGTPGPDVLTLIPTVSGDLGVDLDGDADADRTFSLEDVQTLRVRLLGGDDRLVVDDDVAGLPLGIEVILAAGRGADRLMGGRGPETLVGGPGPDSVSGGQSADTILLGQGADSAAWVDGDGDDVVDGGAGDDAATVRGSVATERFVLAASGAALSITRDVEPVALSLTGIERPGLTPLEGDDTVLTQDLRATEVTAVSLNLGAVEVLGSDPGIDFIACFGTPQVDRVRVVGDVGTATVEGGAGRLDITGADPSDVLSISGFGGDDRLDARGLGDSTLGLGASGGDGNDVMIGGAGDDSLDGGAGDDLIVGHRGTDSVFTDTGDDAVVWSAGDGSDRIGGRDGRDELRLHGSRGADELSVLADGFGGATVLSDPDGVELALDSIEVLTFLGAGGADRVTVGDLSDFRGTGLTDVALDLGPWRDAADQVTVLGSEEDDEIAITGSRSMAYVDAPAADVTLTSTGFGDLLRVNGLGGDDRLDAHALARGPLGLVLDGGEGYDVLLRHAVGDVLLNGEVTGVE